MKCQSLFSGENKKIIINLSSVDLTHSICETQSLVILEYKTLTKCDTNTNAKAITAVPKLHLDDLSLGYNR